MSESDKHSAENTRQENDSLGGIDVPESALWGAQTQRSLQNFAIGDDRFPASFIRAFALVKKAAARSNQELGTLDNALAKLIEQACDEILQGLHDDQFPLSVWQTGSGTQTNMNLNEVIANRANELAGEARGSKAPIHPNDHVNLSQSSNDIFPTCMHVATCQALQGRLYPALLFLQQQLQNKAREFSKEIKSGRTHMMDATPVTLGQEFRAFAQQIEFCEQQIRLSEDGLQALAAGGTAVGTGLNSPPRWAETICRQISTLSELEFRPADNKFSQLAAHDALVSLHGQLNTLAGALLKIVNDIRLMNSGPRCGFNEITIPANEPGSSIMPGKVNPTQVEAVSMVCLRVMGNNVSVSVAGSQGQFQLNTYKPLLIHCVLESITLLTDAMDSFTRNCLAGIAANSAKLRDYMQRSLMLVTALTPEIGYDLAGKAAHYAHEKDISLRDAVVELELMSADRFDELVDPEQMLGARD